MTYDHRITGQVIRKLREKLQCLQGKNSARRQPSPLHLTKNRILTIVQPLRVLAHEEDAICVYKKKGEGFLPRRPMTITCRES